MHGMFAMLRSGSAFRALALLGGLSAGLGARAAEPAAAAPVPLEVTIDAGSTGEAISPLLYGQFVEHLGRCIYGGIWAEMLEDRKFWFPVTPEYDPYRATSGVAKDALLPVVGASPWQITGAADSVVMVEKDSFCGEHTPRIAPGSGIRQLDLALVAGREYTGHVWLRAVEEPATVTVKLSGAEGEARFEGIGAGRYSRHELRFKARESTSKGALSIEVSGAPCLVGTASLMPAGNVRGFRRDTLELLRELGATMYRWPGGNFVSGYDWRDGIGERDRRAPRRNPAWTGVEHNDVGIAEFIDFCRELGAEPLVTVNTGFGDAYSAAQEVEYANGSTDTIGGRWRARDGHPAPYAVRWWCVGNEMYGGWQLGHMALRHYTLKHERVVNAMRKVDSSLRLIAVGALGYRDRGDPGEKRGWTRGMLEACGDHMNLISEHFYCGDKKDLLEHVRQIPEQIRRKAEGHRALRREVPALEKLDVRIAMDEWNYWHRPYVYGELGCVYRLRDALGIAAGLHEYFRQSDIISLANYAQTVNVIGCIKTDKTHAAFATTGLVLKLYRHRFGVTPVKVKVEATGSLDAMAALTRDRKALTVGFVNPTREGASVLLSVKGVSLAGTGRSWSIGGEDPMAYNAPGEEPRVRIVESRLERADEIALGPCSVTVCSLELK